MRRAVIDSRRKHSNLNEPLRFNEDDEERFPRITLWEFLGGVLGGVVNLWLWPSSLPEKPEDEKTRKQDSNTEPPTRSDSTKV